MAESFDTLGALNFGIGFVSNMFQLSAEREAARANARALKEEKAWNLEVLRQQKVDRYWSDMMTQWRSGQALTSGTSAAAVTASNQSVLQRNIEHQERMYDIQIRNYEAQAERRFLGIF